MIIRPLSLDFNYEEAFGNSPPEAYEAPCGLHRGRFDVVHAPRLGGVGLGARRPDHSGVRIWSKPRNCPNYEAASWGPKEADEFMAREGRRWRRP